MHRFITLTQVIFLIALFGAMGGTLGTSGIEAGSFSVWGAVAGAGIAAASIAIAWPLIRRGNVGESLSPTARWGSGLATVVVLAFFASGTLYLYTELPWVLSLVQVLGGAGVLIIF